MGSRKVAMLTSVRGADDQWRAGKRVRRMHRHSRLVRPIPDVIQRLSTREAKVPTRLPKVPLARITRRPRLSFGLSKVLFLQQRGQGEGGFGVGLLLTVDLLGRPGSSEEVGSEDGVDVVVCEGLTECGGLLRSFEREGEGEVASATWYHSQRNAEEGLTFIPVVAGGNPRTSTMD